jgi:hypothetical protein
MKLTSNAQILLDRYLLGVRRALPARKSGDIAAEFESTLLDRLDERYPNSGEVTEDQLKDLLQEMGSPYKVAASYSPQRSLIGPRFYHPYLLVLRIVVPVVIGAVALGQGVGLIAGGVVPGWSVIAQFISSLVNGAFMAAAWVTLTFAVFERTSEGKDLVELADFEKFNPKDLPELAEKGKKPGVVGTLFEIVMAVLGLAFLTYLLYTHGSFPFYVNPSQKLGEVQIFTASYLRYIPFMMVVAVIEIARNVIVLTRSRQGILVDSLQYFIFIAHIIIAVLLLRAFPLVTVDWLKGFAETASWDFTLIQQGVHTFIRWALILSIFGSVVEIVKQLIKQLRTAAA